MTAMLASVRTLSEALTALEGGADFIDLKEPSQGALGALDHAAVRVCVHAIAGRRPVSATIGDIPSMDPQVMTGAVERMAATGVDFIKIGFFAGPRAFDCAKAMEGLAPRARLVAVMFADEPWVISPSPSGRGSGVRAILADFLAALADAGFTGAMLDTAYKTGKSLRDWRGEKELTRFVSDARGRGLLTGLAGSLRQEDIAPLLAVGPDYLGFRGALCRGSNRTQALDAAKFTHIRKAIPAMHAGRTMTTPEVRAEA